MIEINTSPNDYTILKTDVLYQGVFRMVKHHLRVARFQSNGYDVMTREVMERKSAAGVLPYDPIQDKVVLIQQFRPGILGHDENPWIYEIVAGVFDHDESTEAVCIRESKEEAGCDILNLHHIADFYVSPGGSNEHFQCYIGQINTTYDEGFFGLPEEHEDIRAISLPAEEAFQLLDTGVIKTSPAIISLQWLKLNKTWLQTLWQPKQA